MPSTDDLNESTFAEKDKWIQLIRVLSHNARTPLTSILGYADLLARVGPLNDLQKDFINRIQKNVFQINRLIDDSALLARIETTPLKTLEVFDIRNVIKEVVDDLEAALTHKKTSLVVDLPETPVALVGNRQFIRQMVFAILDNAIIFSNPGENINLQVKLENLVIHLSVIDTGVGVPEQDLPFVFDKFYRGSNIVDGVFGNGLGLAIAKAVVDWHHGQIRVDSQEKRGTSVFVSLPVSTEEN